MGFFSDLLAIAAPIAGTLIGGPALGLAAGTAVGALLGDDDETNLAVGRTGGPILTTAQLTGLPGTTSAKIIAATGGVTTGGLRKRTIVETINALGQVVRRKTHKGGVAVFQADVTAANRVARQVRKLDKRLPRKIVKQSEQARLSQEVTNAALRHARDISEHHQLPPRC